MIQASQELQCIEHTSLGPGSLKLFRDEKTRNEFMQQLWLKLRAIPKKELHSPFQKEVLHHELREDQIVYIHSCLQTCSGLFISEQLLITCLEPLAN